MKIMVNIFVNVYIYLLYLFNNKILIIMGRKKTGKKVMSIRVYQENEIELKKMVIEKDKELKNSKKLL